MLNEHLMPQAQQSVAFQRVECKVLARNTSLRNPAGLV
jgi:hypothetical protein